MIITITTMKRKNPAPPQARAIISLVDNVEKKVRTPSLLPEVVGVGAAMSSGVRTPRSAVIYETAMNFYLKKPGLASSSRQRRG